MPSVKRDKRCKCRQARENMQLVQSAKRGNHLTSAKCQAPSAGKHGAKKSCVFYQPRKQNVLFDQYKERKSYYLLAPQVSVSVVPGPSLSSFKQNYSHLSLKPSVPPFCARIRLTLSLHSRAVTVISDSEIQ